VIDGKRIRRTARMKDPLLMILRRELREAEEIAKDIRLAPRPFFSHDSDQAQDEQDEKRQPEEEELNLLE
jgi:hypothetical protein